MYMCKHLIFKNQNLCRCTCMYTNKQSNSHVWVNVQGIGYSHTCILQILYKGKWESLMLLQVSVMNKLI